MISLRRVDPASPALEGWVAARNAVSPEDPATVAAVRGSLAPDALLLLAEREGEVAGCGIADRSSFAGRAFLAVRTLPEHRRHGVGTALLEALVAHARALGLERVNAFADAADPAAVAFARRAGLEEVDYQLQQERELAGAPVPGLRLPPGVELAALDGRRDELLAQAWETVAVQAYEDLPLPDEVVHRREDWLREEATRPDGSFVALEDGAVLGYAGMLEDARGPAVAEHSLTAVRRDRRGAGIGRALKVAQLRWAAGSGVERLVTWTQQGNEAMQALNRSLGYRDVSRVLTMQGPLP